MDIGQIRSLRDDMLKSVCTIKREVDFMTLNLEIVLQARCKLDVVLYDEYSRHESLELRSIRCYSDAACIVA